MTNWGVKWFWTKTRKLGNNKRCTSVTLLFTISSIFSSFLTSLPSSTFCFFAAGSPAPTSSLQTHSPEMIHASYHSNQGVTWQVLTCCLWISPLQLLQFCSFRLSSTETDSSNYQSSESSWFRLGEEVSSSLQWETRVREVGRQDATGDGTDTRKKRRIWKQPHTMLLLLVVVCVK